VAATIVVLDDRIPVEVVVPHLLEASSFPRLNSLRVIAPDAGIQMLIAHARPSSSAHRLERLTWRRS
jgi:hypothetical protein